MKHWKAYTLTAAFVLLTGAALTTPSQIWFTATNGVRRLLSGKLGDVVSASDYSTLQLAITAVGANGTVYVPAGYAETLTTGITISNSGVTLKLEPSATITKGANISMLTITGSSVTIDGGTWDGAQASAFTGAGIVLTSTDKTTIRNATIKNQNTQGIYGTQLTNLSITDNAITGTVSYPIYLDQGLVGAVISRNALDNTSATTNHDIIIHTSTAGRDAKNLVISENRMVNGSAFCVEVGAFSGNAPTNISMTGNVCNVTGASAYGCYSLVGMKNSAANSNTCHMNGNTGTIAGIELVSSDTISVAGNTINGSAALLVGIWLNNTSDSTIVGNIINGFTASTSGGAIRGEGSGVSDNVARNVISANRITFSAGTGALGIVLLANAAGVLVLGNSVTNNVLVGVSGASSDGVRLWYTAGTHTANIVSGNYFESLTNAIDLVGGVGGSYIYGNYYGAQPQIAGTVTNAVLEIQALGYTQANLPAPANGSRIYCSDCTIANPCAGGGNGALAKRLNGTWICN